MPPLRAWVRFVRNRNKIANKRRVKRREVIAYYNSYETRPVHYNKPMWRGILKKLKNYLPLK